MRPSRLRPDARPLIASGLDHRAPEPP